MYRLTRLCVRSMCMKRMLLLLLLPVLLLLLLPLLSLLTSVLVVYTPLIVIISEQRNFSFVCQRVFLLIGYPLEGIPILNFSRFKFEEGASNVNEKGNVNIFNVIFLKFAYLIDDSRSGLKICRWTVQIDKRK